MNLTRCTVQGERNSSSMDFCRGCPSDSHSRSSGSGEFEAIRWIEFFSQPFLRRLRILAIFVYSNENRTGSQNEERHISIPSYSIAVRHLTSWRDFGTIRGRRYCGSDHYRLPYWFCNREERRLVTSSLQIMATHRRAESIPIIMLVCSRLMRIFGSDCRASSRAPLRVF